MCECASQFATLIAVNNSILAELVSINAKITTEHDLTRTRITDEHILTRDRITDELTSTRIRLSGEFADLRGRISLESTNSRNRLSDEFAGTRSRLSHESTNSRVYIRNSIGSIRGHLIRGLSNFRVRLSRWGAVLNKKLDTEAETTRRFIYDELFSGSSPANAANVFVQEYLHNKDMDGDGKIYGFDFVVADPPPILATITDTVLRLAAEAGETLPVEPAIIEITDGNVRSYDSRNISPRYADEP